MLKMFRKIRNNYQGGIICLTVIGVMFGGIGIKMGAAPMLNTIMNTAHAAEHRFLSDGHLCDHGCAG